MTAIATLVSATFPLRSAISESGRSHGQTNSPTHGPHAAGAPSWGRNTGPRGPLSATVRPISAVVPLAAQAARPGVLSPFSWLLHVAQVRDFLTRTMCAGPRRSLALSDDCLLPSTLPEVVEAVRTLSRSAPALGQG
jgi:hypothetical protein